MNELVEVLDRNVETVGSRTQLVEQGECRDAAHRTPQFHPPFPEKHTLDPLRALFINDIVRVAAKRIDGMDGLSFLLRQKRERIVEAGVAASRYGGGC